MRQLQQLFQPVFLRLGPAFDGCGALATNNHATDSDHHDIDQTMSTVTCVTRIWQRLKMLDHRIERNRNASHHASSMRSSSHMRREEHRKLEDGIAESDASR